MAMPLDPSAAQSKSAQARATRAAAAGRRVSKSSSMPALPYRIRGDPYRPPVEGVIDNLDKRKGPQRLKELHKELSPLEAHDPNAKEVKHHAIWSWPAGGAWTNFHPTANRLLEESYIDGERVCRIWDTAQGGGVMLREFDLDNKLVMPGFRQLRREFQSEFPPVQPVPEVVRPKYEGGPIKPSQCFKWRVGKTGNQRKYAATPPAVENQSDRFAAMAYWAGLAPKEVEKPATPKVFHRPSITKLPDRSQTQEPPTPKSALSLTPTSKLNNSAKHVSFGGRSSVAAQ